MSKGARSSEEQRKFNASLGMGSGGVKGKMEVASLGGVQVRDREGAGWDQDFS